MYMNVKLKKLCFKNGFMMMLFMINHCIPVLKLDAKFLHTRVSIAILKEIEKVSTDGPNYG